MYIFTVYKYIQPLSLHLQKNNYHQTDGVEDKAVANYRGRGRGYATTDNKDSGWWQ